MIIVVGCNKGGSSKTTTSTNLSVGLAMQGHDVCLVDADPQRSASRWHKDREDQDVNPPITLVEKQDNLTQTLRTLEDKFDYVIVDVAGRNSREMITGAVVADIVLAPHQASQLDLDTLEELKQQTVQIRDLNPDLSVLIYHSMASTNPNVIGNERNDFEEYVGQYDEFVLLNSVGHYRKIYKDVIPDGQSVLETANIKAIAEVNNLMKEVLSYGC